MGRPVDCTRCHLFESCAAAMYTEGCQYYPPNIQEEKKPSLFKKFFGKFFK